MQTSRAQLQGPFASLTKSAVAQTRSGNKATTDTYDVRCAHAKLVARLSTVEQALNRVRARLAELSLAPNDLITGMTLKARPLVS